MQEPLIEYKGIVCDECGSPTSDHTYYQVSIPARPNGDCSYDMYLCSRCYKDLKEVERD